MHMQPLFAHTPFVTDTRVWDEGGACAEAEGSVDGDIFRHAVCLPSGDALTETQIAEIVENIRGCFDHQAGALREEEPAHE